MGRLYAALHGLNKVVRGTIVILMRGFSLLAVVVVLGVSPPALVASPKKGNTKTGEKLYVASCQICHGPAGNGNPDMTAYYLTPLPDLSAKKTQDKTDAQLRSIILKGHGTDMWAYAGAFEEDQLGDVIAYIRSLKP
ncbi:cytochrome [Nitrospira sp.]|nr:cytochrome [Nitrospira sp.]